MTDKTNIDPVKRLRHLQTLDDSDNRCFCDSIMVDRDCPVHFRENRWDETLKREAFQHLPRLLDEIEHLRELLIEGGALKATVECHICANEVQTFANVILAHNSPFADKWGDFDPCRGAGTFYVEAEQEPEPPSTIDTLREAREGAAEIDDPDLVRALDEAIVAVERANENACTTFEAIEITSCKVCGERFPVKDGLLIEHNGPSVTVLHPTNPNFDGWSSDRCRGSGRKP